MTTPASVIAKAMDAWRIRLWLAKGPRCRCGCSERGPWSKIPEGYVRTFDVRMHIPTERRLHGNSYESYEDEERYIPPTLEGFKAYLVERRNVLHGYMDWLYVYCVRMGEAWMCALLSYGHATWKWQSASHCPYKAVVILHELVAKNWFQAANSVLTWPITAARLSEEDMMYLVKKPYRTGFEHMDRPFNAAQRNWILNHPALAEQSRKARAHKHWMQVFLWTGVVKSCLRAWKKGRVPLPIPCKENVPAFQTRIESGEFRLQPGTPFYQDMLNWVAFLAKESPGTLHKLLPKIGYKSQWLADVIEVLAPTGRVGRLYASLRVFGRYGDPHIQVEKVWQWANNPAFAIPRIAKALLYMATYILPWAKQNNLKRGLVRSLLEGEAIVRTIDDNAVWLSKKLPDDALLKITSKRRRCQAVVAALRGTPRFHSLQRIAALRATVYLTLFFRNHVRLTQTRSVIRGDCPICWTPKILQPLHGDSRHGMCCSCKRELERKNMLDRCPMCRVSLRTPASFASEFAEMY